MNYLPHIGSRAAEIYENLNTALGDEVSFEIPFSLDDIRNLRVPPLKQRTYFKE